MEPMHVGLFIDITLSSQILLEAEPEVRSRSYIHHELLLNSWGSFLEEEIDHMATQGADWLLLYSGYDSHSMCVTMTGYGTCTNIYSRFLI